MARAFNAVEKKVTVQYGKRSGNPKIEFWLIDTENYIKKISPRQFKHCNIVNTTNDHNYKEAFGLLYGKLDFRDKVDMRRELEGLTNKEKFERVF